VRHRYRRLRAPDNPDALADELHRRMARREAGELERLRQVCDLVGHDGCQTAMLAAHFGEGLESACGHCSGCQGAVDVAPARGAVDIPDNLREPLKALLEEKGEVLDTPRAVTRLLCGISSPRLSRARLGQHPLFGTLAEVPFAQVEAWLAGEPASRHT